MMILDIAIFAVFVAAVPTTPQSSAEVAEEAEIVRAEQQFGSAVAANDTRGISGVTAEDWQIIDGDGHIIPRAGFLQVIASGALKHSSLSSTDKTVRVYGDTAIVTGHAKSAGTFGGTAFSTDEIATDVWIRTKDGWRCVLTQLTTRKP